MLSLPPLAAIDNQWQFDDQLRRAHLLILNLQTEQARTLLATLNTPGRELQNMYVQSLGETVDVLITEDEQKFKTLEDNFHQRLKQLESLPATGETLFLQAELNLQLGFNYLNLGQELNAVLSIRRASNFVSECQKKFPAFIPIYKTDGVIQVMIGAVPEKYKWFMGLLGLKGSVAVGQRELEQLKSSRSSLNVEAVILYHTIKGFINQQFDEAAKGLQEYLKKDPENRLVMFLAINMLIKNSQSEDAYRLLQTMDKQTSGLPVYYIEYLRGEVLLQRGDYADAITAYTKFIQGYKSQSFKKDSYYKISLCYWLQGKTELARQNFEKAKTTGKETAEPDKYASRQLQESTLPNVKLLKVRFATDGGYYKEAREELQRIGPVDLVNEKEKTEYYYRKARLAHKTGEAAAAKLFYVQTITMAAQNPWYFAPSSALQLGYIAEMQKDYPTAKKYFEQALSYKRHEYKSSIDGSAKAALERIALAASTR